MDRKDGVSRKKSESASGGGKRDTVGPANGRGIEHGQFRTEGDQKPKERVRPSFFSSLPSFLSSFFLPPVPTLSLTFLCTWTHTLSLSDVHSLTHSLTHFGKEKYDDKGQWAAQSLLFGWDEGNIYRGKRGKMCALECEREGVYDMGIRES